LMRRQLVLVLGVALVAISLVGFAPLAGAAPVSAKASSTQYCMHTDDKDPGGRVCFKPNGDWVTLCDIEPDGWAVYTEVTDLVTSEGYGMTVGGNNNCHDKGASDGGVYNLGEHHDIKFRICLYSDDSDNSYCDTSVWPNTN
jgi:hypothetical protein